MAFFNSLFNLKSKSIILNSWKNNESVSSSEMITILKKPIVLTQINPESLKGGLEDKKTNHGEDKEMSFRCSQAEQGVKI